MPSVCTSCERREEGSVALRSTSRNGESMTSSCVGAGSLELLPSGPEPPLHTLSPCRLCLIWRSRGAMPACTRRQRSDWSMTTLPGCSAPCIMPRAPRATSPSATSCACRRRTGHGSDRAARPGGLVPCSQSMRLPPGSILYTSRSLSPSESLRTAAHAAGGRRLGWGTTACRRCAASLARRTSAGLWPPPHSSSGTGTTLSATGMPCSSPVKQCPRQPPAGCLSGGIGRA
mmetsp:Transcript_8565/g.24586  ORF Transcript_8565/g.24586 Transcript_8565/m.24586 type:complete len:231 (+) Transcript_8565:1317-2009(+)